MPGKIKKDISHGTNMITLTTILLLMSHGNSIKEDTIKKRMINGCNINV